MSHGDKSARALAAEVILTAHDHNEESALGKALRSTSAYKLARAIMDAPPSHVATPRSACSFHSMDEVCANCDGVTFPCAAPEKCAFPECQKPGSPCGDDGYDSPPSSELPNTPGAEYAEPLTAEPKAKAEREAEQGVGFPRPGPLSSTRPTGRMPLEQRIENLFSFLYAEPDGNPCHFDRDFLDEVKAAALRGCVAASATLTPIPDEFKQLAAFYDVADMAALVRIQEERIESMRQKLPKLRGPESDPQNYRKG